MPKNTLEDLTRARKLDQRAFSQTPGLSLDSPIEDHVKWAFRNIYSVPYPADDDSDSEWEPKEIAPKDIVARMHHGIQHVTRAAMYVPVIANLYRKYEDKAALKLTEEKLKLLQIAVLFHDSARLNEDKDFWDQQSGDLLYYYLTKVLKVSEEEAQELADAVANKDRPSASKNIFEKIIHDADCLEIMRARPHFDANYLDFHNDFAEEDDHAFQEMAQLIREVKSIIEAQKDGYGRVLHKEKKYFETMDAYHRIKETFVKDDKKDTKEAEEKKLILNVLDVVDPRDHYQIISKLASKLLSAEELKEPLLKDYKPKARNIFFRGIIDPSAIRIKEIKFPQTEETRPLESMASVEIRKSLREEGTPTRTSKDDALRKDGNPWRSISIEGSYTAAGFFGELDFSHLYEIHAIDKVTGNFKKTEFKSKTKKSLSIEEKKKQLSELNRLLDMGGASVKFNKSISTHTELIYHIKPGSFKGVYFTLDPTLFHKDMSLENYYATHKNSPILQAIFLQKEYEKQTGIKLPLYEYSSSHSYFVEKTFNDDDIIAMWREMCVAYIQEFYGKNKDADVAAKSLDQLKIGSMYHHHLLQRSSTIFAGYFPGDSNYDDELKYKLNQSIESVRKELEEKRFLDVEKEVLKLVDESTSISFLKKPYIDYFANYPKLLENKIINESVQNLIDSQNVTKKLEEFDKYAGENRYDWQGLENIYFFSKKMDHSLTAKIKETVLMKLQNHISNIGVRNCLEIAKEFDLSMDDIIYKEFYNKIAMKDNHDFYVAVKVLHENKILDKALAEKLSRILSSNIQSEYRKGKYSITDVAQFCSIIELLEIYFPLPNYRTVMKILITYYFKSRKELSIPTSGIYYDDLNDILKSVKNDLDFFKLILDNFDSENSMRNLTPYFSVYKEKINKSCRDILGKYFTAEHQGALEKLFIDFLLKTRIQDFVEDSMRDYPGKYEYNTEFKKLINHITDVGYYIVNEAVYSKLKEEINNIINFPRKDELLDFVENFKKQQLDIFSKENKELTLTEFKNISKGSIKKDEKMILSEEISLKNLYQCRRELEKLKETKNVNMELIKDIHDKTVLLAKSASSFYDIEQFLQCSKFINEYGDTISTKLQKETIISFLQSYPNKKIIDHGDPEKKLGVNLFSYTDFYKDDTEFLKLLINSLSNWEIDTYSFNWEDNKISKYYDIFSNYLGDDFNHKHKIILEEALSQYAIRIVNGLYGEIVHFVGETSIILEDGFKIVKALDTFILNEEVYQSLIDKTEKVTNFSRKDKDDLIQFIDFFKEKMHQETSKLKNKEMKEKIFEKQIEKQKENKTEPEKQSPEWVSFTLLRDKTDSIEKIPKLEEQQQSSSITKKIE